MKKIIQKKPTVWDYLPLITAYISILSLGRPGIPSIKILVMNSSSAMVLKNFSPILFLLIPVAASIWKHIGITLKVSAWLKRTVFLLFLSVNLVLTFTFLPKSEMNFYYHLLEYKSNILILFMKTCYNLYICFLLTRGYASSTQDEFLLTKFISQKAKSSRITNDYNEYIKQHGYCTVLCYTCLLYTSIYIGRSYCRCNPLCERRFTIG